MDISKKTITGYIVNNLDFTPKEKIKNDPVTYMAIPSRFHLDFSKEKSQYESISIFLNKEDAEEHREFVESNTSETCIIKEVEINIK
tara:strand:+ start:442 stop:702 length:261 start_codon:yes stop_codon:yes gene_type:complete